MINTLTSNVLSLAAHAAILFCVLWNRMDYVYASLPPVEVPHATYDDLDASLGVCIGCALAFAVVELLLILRQIPPASVNVTSLLVHCLACMVLMKFTVDEHPVYHFWIAFGLFSAPPLLMQLSCLISSFNKRNFC
ncbi:hypothetical protein AAVH_04768 [Aphelenchoides avenae]|nr:hypothetical protein AAVH_04768 [Aphelenchus avenae]